MNPDRAPITVILPYYNRADTVEEAAVSVLQQTHQELTLYLINDGSTDSSPAIVRRLSDERVMHVDQAQTGGPARARNVGLAIAATELVAFMDSDDVWLPEKLQLQLNELRTAQRRFGRVAVIGCGWMGYTEERPTASFVYGPHRRRDVLSGNVSGIGTPMLLVDRSLVATNVRFDERFPAFEERDFVLTCLHDDATLLVVLPQTLTRVRRGRNDHVATSQRAAAGYEILLEKYSHELAGDPAVRASYAYRASREYLIHGDLLRAARHLKPALARQPVKRSIHLLLGAAGRRRGLDLAHRLLPL